MRVLIDASPIDSLREVPLAMCVAALFEVDLMKCDVQSRTNSGAALLCRTGVTQWGDCGLSINTVAWIQGVVCGPPQSLTIIDTMGPQCGTQRCVSWTVCLPWERQASALVSEL